MVNQPSVRVYETTVTNVRYWGIYVARPSGDVSDAPAVSGNLLSFPTRRSSDLILITGEHLLPAQLAGNSGSSNKSNVIAVSETGRAHVSPPHTIMTCALGPTNELAVPAGLTVTLNAGAVLKFDPFTRLPVSAAL